MNPTTNPTTAQGYGSPADSGKRDNLRRERRAFHKAWLESKGAKVTDFTVKMSWTRNNQPVIALFENEANRPGGLYLELTDKNHELLEPGKVYWVRPNPHYQQELEAFESGNSYYMPVDELVAVRDPYQEKKIEQQILQLEEKTKAVPEDMDEHFSKMTIRDFAAVMLRKPVSNKGWLNEVIRKNT